MADHTKGQTVQVRTGPGRWVSAEVSGFTTRGHVKAIIDGRERHFPPDRVRVPATVVLRRPAEVPTSDEADSYERARERSAGTVPAPLRAVPKAKAIRSASYLEFVRQHPCCCCGQTAAIEAHHIVTGGMGRKASDRLTAPLTAEHHSHWHQHGYLPGRDRIGSLGCMWEASARIQDEYETQRETRR